MSVTNLPPSVEDVDLVKTIAFPFQKGPFNFPAMAIPENSIFNKIVSLLNTAKGERVMNYDFGIDIHEFVFKEMTPIDRMRLSSGVKNAIETYIQNVVVDRVNLGQLKYESGVGSTIYVDIEYSVLGQPHKDQIEFSPGGQVE